MKPEHLRGWGRALKIALDFRRKEGGIDHKEVQAEAEYVVAYGIRDWSAEPYGGAVHLWRPGSIWEEDETDDPLVAFSLRERTGSAKNVHICGDTYSADQGFIEGALATAERAVKSIVGRDSGLSDSGTIEHPKEQQRRLQEEWRRLTTDEPYESGISMETAAGASALAWPKTV